MSMFENNNYRWRETYFVLFHSSDRPELLSVERALAELNDRYLLKELLANDDGRFDSLTLLSPDDFAALDICYTTGAEVLEQGAELADDMAKGEDETAERVRHCDARFDVLHFEEVPELGDEGEEEMLDPSALLLVLEALARITNGLAIDPQAGAIVSDQD